MATYQDGSQRRATPNTVKAMERSARTRQCPECGRKSALVRRVWDDGQQAGVSCCRWAPERCTLDQAEAHRRWIALWEHDELYTGPRPIPSFARTMEAHRRALAHLTGQRDADPTV